VLNYRYFRKKPKEADLKQLAERKAKYKLAETNA
jgi:hypothetical protein